MIICDCLFVYVFRKCVIFSVQIMIDIILLYVVPVRSLRI